MTELLTAAQMRAIEQAAIRSGQVTGLELMERAGRGVVDAIFEEWRELSKMSGTAVVLCGPGNNGGDGFVVARLLKQWGWEVSVFLFGDPVKLPPDAKTNYQQWSQSEPVYEFSSLHTMDDAGSPDLIVDAVFGTGLVRQVEGELAETLEFLGELRGPGGAKIVAIDTPSGLCSDSGRALGVFTTADLTVAFHRAKRGHYLDHGAIQSGHLVVKSIGLGTVWDTHAEGSVARLVTGPAARIGKQPQTNKYTYGHALILSGLPGKTGAARLAARGALRIGAGLATLAVDPAALVEVASQITAIMLQPVKSAEDLSDLLRDDRLNALCLGPALGLDRARALAPVALSAKRPTVLDADALSAFVEDPTTLFNQLHEACVLTPHAGEFARLFPDLAEKLHATATQGPAYSKLDAASEAARRAGCIVLFKGPDTVISAPDGRCSVNSAQYDRSAPWLATAGSGDVLAGFITGLLARGFDPMEAAETAAWLHVECARSFGPGLIAEDLPEEIPVVLQRLESHSSTG